MANRSFNNEADLQKAVERILTRDVAPIMKKILRKHILDDVYGAYTPKEGGWVGHTTYQRRHLLENNIETLMINPFTIGVTSLAPAAPAEVRGYTFEERQEGSLLELIEADEHGIWHGGFPRYPIRNAQEEINKSTEIEQAIQDGLDAIFS